MRCPAIGSYEPLRTRTRVLVVVEDATLHLLCDEALADDIFHVMYVSDSVAALTIFIDESITAEPFDLIVTAFRVDDLQQLNFLKVAAHQPAAPTIILIGTRSIDAVLGALHLGATDYLIEPIKPAQLLTSVTIAVTQRHARLHRLNVLEATIGNLLRFQGHPVTYADYTSYTDRTPQGQLNVGELTIDIERHTIRWCGQPCAVTPIEYAFLRYMAETPNRVRRYGEIVRWTHGYSTDENEAKLLLKTHVRNLRRKLGTDILVNLKGTGYILQTGSEQRQPATNAIVVDHDSLPL